MKQTVSYRNLTSMILAVAICIFVLSWLWLRRFFSVTIRNEGKVRSTTPLAIGVLIMLTGVWLMVRALVGIVHLEYETIAIVLAMVFGGAIARLFPSAADIELAKQKRE